MKARSKAEAWKIVDEFFPTDYEKNEERSAENGYDVYHSAADITVPMWIADHEDHLEIGICLDHKYTKVVRIDIDPGFGRYHIYQVYLDDGSDNVIKVLIPAVSEDDALDWVEGNGEVVAVKDVTDEHLFSEQMLHEMTRALHADGYSPRTANIITRLIEQTGLAK